MASIRSNIGKDSWNFMARMIKTNALPNAAFVVRMLKLAESLAVLQDYETLADVLAVPGNTECDFTNYPAGGIILTDLEIEMAVLDHVANDVEWSNPQFQIANAGGVTNNDIPIVNFSFDMDTTSGTDADIIPLSYHDDGRTTDGSTEIWLAGTLSRAT